MIPGIARRARGSFIRQTRARGRGGGSTIGTRTRVRKTRSADQPVTIIARRAQRSAIRQTSTCSRGGCCSIVARARVGFAPGDAVRSIAGTHLVKDGTGVTVGTGHPRHAKPWPC